MARATSTGGESSSTASVPLDKDANYPRPLVATINLIDDNATLFTNLIFVCLFVILSSFISVLTLLVSIGLGVLFCLILWHGMRWRGVQLFEEDQPNDDDDRNKIMKACPIIAHKGGGHCAPENTLVAIEQAHQEGISAVEFDVVITKDNVPILVHDITVDGTTDGHGKVADLTLEDIQTLNASAHHPLRDKFGRVPIPTLTEVVELCLRLKLEMFIDVKDTSGKVLPLIVNLFKRNPELYKNAYVCSLYPYVIYKVTKADSGIQVALTYRPKFFYKDEFGAPKPGLNPIFLLLCPVLDTIYGWLFHHWLWLICRVRVVLLHKNSVSKTVVQYWKGLGIQLVVWTVNDAKEQAMMSDVMECAYITDCVGACK